MWFNPLISGLLRSPFHGPLSSSTMLITVRGKKTGRRLITPVNYLRRDGDLLTVSFRSRTWWRNLRGGAPVELLLAGERRSAAASVTETDAEVERGLAEIAALAPGRARYWGVALDASGRPVASDLARAAKERVVVRAHLVSPDGTR